MGWEYHQAVECFDDFAPRWDALNQSAYNHILLDSRFVGASLRCFGDDKILLGVDENSPCHGMMLATRTAPGIWETFQPSQAPLGLVITGRNQDPDESLHELLHSLPGPAIQFGVLQQDPDFSLFSKISSSPQVEIQDYIRTPRLELVGTYDEYWNNRSKNLKHNLSRQRKRLAEQTRRIELVVHRDPSIVGEAVGEFGRLESQGWKGREGTAVGENNSQGRFYRDILRAFCATGEGVVYQLRLDGRVVASDLCLVRNGMLVVLKTAYDETLQQLSPALLMREEIVQQLYQEKMIRVVEFYGKVLDWHLKWTDEVRTMYHINYFRNRWVARMRGLIKNLR